MPLLLREATASDAHALSEIYLSAFTIDAISLLCFPRDNNKASYNFWAKSIIEEIVNPNTHFLCIYSSQDSSQSPVAYAKWKLWNPSDAAATLHNPTQWPAGADSELADHFFGNLLRKHNEIMGSKRHWYLELLATRPEWQGKGAAGKLLRWGIEKADLEEMETYLEASPDGKPIYEHFGFEERDKLVVELSGDGDGPLSEKEFIEVMMVRPAMSKRK